MINPDPKEPDQNLNAATTISTYRSTEDGGIAVADMTSAYAPKATSVKRGFQFADHRSTVVVQDEVVTPAPSDVYWGMHTAAKITISDDKRSAILEQERQAALGRHPVQPTGTVQHRPAAAHARHVQGRLRPPEEVGDRVQGSHGREADGNAGTTFCRPAIADPNAARDALVRVGNERQSVTGMFTYCAARQVNQPSTAMLTGYSNPSPTRPLTSNITNSDVYEFDAAVIHKKHRGVRDDLFVGMDRPEITNSAKKLLGLAQEIDSFLHVRLLRQALNALPCLAFTLASDRVSRPARVASSTRLIVSTLPSVVTSSGDSGSNLSSSRIGLSITSA